MVGEVKSERQRGIVFAGKISIGFVVSVGSKKIGKKYIEFLLPRVFFPHLFFHLKIYFQ